MDKKTFYLVALTALFINGQTLAENKAQKPGARAESAKNEPKKINKDITKIGFVNVGQLLGAAPQAKKSKEILEKEFSDRDKQLVAKQKEIGDKEQAYQKDVAILSESQRSKREREIISLKRNFKRLREEFEEDLALRKNEELRKLQQTVAVTIDKVANDGGYDLIVNEGVVFASKNIDISVKVLDELKKLAAEEKAESAKAKLKKK